MNLYKSFHHRDPPTLPLHETRQPCGLPTTSNHHLPFFQHLGTPEPTSGIPLFRPVSTRRKKKTKKTTEESDAEEVVEAPAPVVSSSAKKSGRTAKAQSVPAGEQVRKVTQGGSGEVRTNRAYILVPPLSYCFAPQPEAGPSGVKQGDPEAGQRGISVPIMKVGPPRGAKHLRSPQYALLEGDADVLTRPVVVQEERSARRRKVRHAVVLSDDESEQPLNGERENDENDKNNKNDRNDKNDKNDKKER